MEEREERESERQQELKKLEMESQIKKETNSPVELHTSDQAWKPSGKSVAPIISSGEEDVTQKLYKTARSILNKLTRQNFDTLLKQVKKLQIDTEGRLSGCMDLVFEKAISEPSFCVAYAKMAHNISTMKVPSKEDPAEFVSFRKLLLNRCQTEFEKDKIEEIELERRQKEIDECESEEKKKPLILEKEEVTRKARRRSLGNIRFIGELFKMKMLTERIMFDCLARLMKTDDEDSIKCLCCFLRTIGKDLDQPRNKKALDPLFTEISKKSDSKNVSLRTKFMLQDINELRANTWVPRRVDVNPRTIEQIHKEAQQEEQQKQAFISQSPMLPNNNFSHYSQQMQNMQKNSMDGRSGSGAANRLHGNQRGHQVSEEGWTTFTSKGGGRGPAVIIDHTKLRLSKQNVDEMPIKLGPCRPQWSQGAGSGGSSGVGVVSQFQSGSRHSSQESEKSSTSSSNRYAVFGSLRENHDFQRTNRTPAFKDPASAARHPQYYRIQAKGGYGSLPLSSRSKNNTDQSSRPNSGSCNASRDSSLSREASNRASPVMYPSMPSKQQMPVIGMPTTAMQSMPVDKDLVLDEVVFRRKTKYLVDEYISIKDEKEALLSAQELHMLGSSTALQLFVYTIINHVIEKSTNDLQMAGNLLYLFHKNSIIDTKSLTAGLEEGLRDAPDLEIDIPRIWDRYSDLLGSMLIQSFDLFQLISDAIYCLRSGTHAAPLVARCMLKVAKHYGVQQAVSMWNARSISWSQFTDKNLHDFTIENKLESLLPISSELLILMSSQADNDVIFSWINDHVHLHEHEAMFIRSLVTAACNASLRVQGDVYELEEVIFRKYCSLLNKYIDHKADREMQSLFAIQSLVHSLEHPPNVLNSFFHMLYDVELISEDAFWEWEKCDDPLEQNGKGVATVSTKPFFQWLRESIEEEDTS